MFRTVSVCVDQHPSVLYPELRLKKDVLLNWRKFKVALHPFSIFILNFAEICFDNKKWGSPSSLVF